MTWPWESAPPIPKKIPVNVKSEVVDPEILVSELPRENTIENVQFRLRIIAHILNMLEPKDGPLYISRNSPEFYDSPTGKMRKNLEDLRERGKQIVTDFDRSGYTVNNLRQFTITTRQIQNNTSTIPLFIQKIPLFIQNVDKTLLSIFKNKNSGISLYNIKKSMNALKNSPKIHKPLNAMNRLSKEGTLENLEVRLGIILQILTDIESGMIRISNDLSYNLLKKSYTDGIQVLEAQDVSAIPTIIHEIDGILTFFFKGSSPTIFMGTSNSTIQSVNVTLDIILDRMNQPVSRGGKRTRKNLHKKRQRKSRR